jgi:type IV secretion system protein VirD4
VYDPAEVTGLPGSRWNPLSSATTWTEARRLAAAFSSEARSTAGSFSDAEFWYSTAAKLLAPLLHAAALSGRSMQDVVRWVDEQEEDEVEAILEAADAQEALRAARASWQRDDRQRSAVYTTAETVIDVFADPVVARWTGPAASGPETVAQGQGERQALDPGRLLEGGDTIYLCAPSHDQGRLRPLFATLVAAVLDTAYRRANATGAPVDPPLLVVLDEAANLAPVAKLDELAATAAGHGVQLVTVWQDFSQITARFGPRSGTVVNNHRAKLFLSGIADPTTLEHASALAGDADRPVRTVTRDRQGGGSTSDSLTSRRLLPPDALRRLSPGDAVLLAGHLPPVRLGIRPWRADPALRGRAVPQARPGQSGPGPDKVHRSWTSTT